MEYNSYIQEGPYMGHPMSLKCNVSQTKCIRMNKHAVLEIIYYSKMSLVISLLGLIFVNSMLFM